MKKLFIASIENKGRGVFAAVTFSKDDVLEVCPLIITNPEDLSALHTTYLHDFYFLWGQAQNQAAIALGYGSLYNHSDTPNAYFNYDYDNKTIDFVALSSIEIGQEITVDYQAGMETRDLWFKTQADQE